MAMVGEIAKIGKLRGGAGASQKIKKRVTKHVQEKKQPSKRRANGGKSEVRDDALRRKSRGEKFKVKNEAPKRRVNGEKSTIKKDAPKRKVKGEKVNVQNETPKRSFRRGAFNVKEGQESLLRKEIQKKNSLRDPNFIENLNKMDERKLNGGLRGIGTTGSTLFSGAKKYFLDPVEGAARRKSAYKGTFQAAATSAAGHAGIAALNGDDPWEAAKTGAVRGAKVGGGYQTLKGATGANAGSIWGNVKHINATTKDLYRATTVKGREQLRKEGVSGSLSTLLSMESGVASNKAFFSKKGNISTAQAMNQ